MNLKQRTAAVFLVLVAAWIGVRVHAGRDPAIDHERGVAVPAGEASAPTPADLAAAADPATPGFAKIPERLPEFTLDDRNGKPTSIDSWAGRSLVINFWATWCAPCRREIPLLQAVHRDWAGEDVSVIGIAVDHRDQVLAFADQFKIAYPLLIGEQDALDVAGQLGVATPAFPFTVFTDRRARVVAVFMGELGRPQAELILSVVRNVNQDRLQLPAARQLISDGLTALKAAKPI
jgi:thiol-disulfide isomerase/thioredoxin